MIDDRLLAAIDRLERAIVTLETTLPPVLAAQATPTPADDGATTDENVQALRDRYDRLEERHAALRERTTSAVERLSLLLDSAQGE